MDKPKGGRGRGRKRKEVSGRHAPDPQPTQAAIPSRGLFSRDLKQMMYGFGDAEDPYSETVDVMEDLVVDYVSTLIKSAVDTASGKGSKPTVTDLMFLIRKDPAKYARAQQLLKMDVEIKQAKKVEGEEDMAAFAGQE